MAKNIDTETIISDDNGAVGSFNIHQYSTNLNDQVTAIKSKIKECEAKLRTLKNKEKIINSMIDRTGIKIEQYIENENHKMAGINQRYVLDYFETLGVVQETLMKYEDLVYKYTKMLLDIENHKIGAYTKIKAADKKVDAADNNYLEMQDAIDKIMNIGKDGSSRTNKDMLELAKNELKLEGY